MQHKLLLFISVFFIPGACSKNNKPINLTEQIQALKIIPSSQNGYGKDADQLAQPDDVELLPDGSMIVTDVDNNRIQYFSSEGLLQKSITARELGLTNEEIIPTGIARDSKGFIYVTLEGVGHIARLTPDLVFDQFIGKPCEVSAEDYYKNEHHDCLIKPQGLTVSNNGDIYVIDMAKKVFKKNGKRNFGFKKFKKITDGTNTTYQYDQAFSQTQEITSVMRKSEGMAISLDQKTLFIAEEKPHKSQFGNQNKYRYVAGFDLKTGRFLNKLFGVTKIDGSIVGGIFHNSVEGVCVFDNYLFAVDEKGGKVVVFESSSGNHLGFLGERAYYYCDDESDCIIEGINYSEQAIIVGDALPHLKNDWRKNAFASPDGISAVRLKSGVMRLAVVDQWNSRIVLYDLEDIIKYFE
ncbi:MAG: hypothetical protein HOB40_06895 [Candidatus Marinimicrobia bacterium]|jgi:sugar lactone lactonase YvrE|nr:hypothetical protein [Candidatus Neomarinimicrobiota bacterium]MBT4178206.1 hypothetical protein [Candidatus Neomarinimicrobiota bacterium]MBT5356320.1 hypothetical protein [Candidatus Neomarinimicrobiota bacterium]MBT6000827.1 hypothetical protein [Candidatus Neomarinimicrobiota bacterium]MBT6159040.1 hypothetical protein [Candidatus Neomarinimicrobiota bacterium]